MDETTGKPVLCTNAAGYGTGRENAAVWRAGETDGKGAEGVYCGGKIKMKNEYMFFSKQEFADINLDGYIKNDINIPKTEIHIYQFECKSEEESNDENKAKKLDELTNIFKKIFSEQFILISSESSQYFCARLYPLVMDFETQLRYALYISRALYSSEGIDISSFLLEIGKSKEKIEALDFGQIYEAVFTDKIFQEKIKKLSGEKWSKTDLIKSIQSWEEETIWKKMVGKDYDYIENNFLKLKEFRNHVMHSHLIDFNTYDDAKKTLESATKELKKAIDDKLIVNESAYLNMVDIIKSVGNMLTKFSEYIADQNTEEKIENITRTFSLLGKCAKVIAYPYLDEENIEKAEESPNE